MFKSHSKLGYQLLKRILIVSSIITFVLTGFQLYRDYSVDLDLIDLRLKQIESTRIDSIEDSLWTYNLNTLETQLKEIVRLEDINYVAILSPKDQVEFEFGQKVTDNSFRTKKIALYYDFNDERQFLGTLVIKANLDNVYKRLEDKTLVILASQAIKTFLVSSFILFFIYQLIALPLNKLSTYLKDWSFDRLSLGHLSNVYPEQREDELSELNHAIKSLQSRLKSSYQKLERSTNNFKQIYEGSNDAILVFDLNNHLIVDANNKSLEMFGYSIQELVGLRTDSLFIPEADATVSFFREIEEKRSSVTELTFLTKYGEKVIAETSASEITFDNNQAILALVRDNREQRKQEQKIHHMAYHDELTQLPNRALLNDRLEQTIARSKRYKTHGSVTILDLDNFKMVNDTLGHSIGDLLLIKITERFKSILETEETVARLGGDEFIFLLADDSDSFLQANLHATNLVNKLQSIFQEPFDVDGHPLSVSFSAGIAIYPDNGDTVDDLLRRADSAMYSVKQTGRAGFATYKEDLEEDLHYEFKLHNELKSALKNREFYLVYQPKVDPKLEVIKEAEVLLRWKNKELGFVSPVDFIPVLEQTGGIYEVGQWVLETASSQWQKAINEKLIPSDLKLSINASPSQFMAESFIEIVKNSIHNSHINPKILELEITEETLIENYQKTQKQMHLLKQLNVSLALDDFGTGFSSLSYLHKLPVQTLKIDKTFVDKIAEDDRLAVLVSSILSMAHDLKLNTVAEGVETSVQLDFFKKNNCDLIQGYYFSKPLEWDDFVHYVAKHLEE